MALGVGTEDGTWRVASGTVARPPWSDGLGSDGKRHRYLHRHAATEWMPRPHAGRIMVPSRAERDARLSNPLRGPITLMIVPGPQGLLQIVRIELNTPVARGFATKEGARAWIERAIRAGVLPEGVVEVEPPGAEEP